MEQAIKRSEIKNVDWMPVTDHSGPEVLHYDVISHVGNNSEDWRMSRQDAVTRIREKEEQFFTRHPNTGREIPITIYKGEYLRSERDDTEEDNLDELPPCSPSCTNYTFHR